MKQFKQNIIVPLIVFGVFTWALVGDGFSSSVQFFIECELEESADNIDESVFEDLIFDTDSNDGDGDATTPKLFPSLIHNFCYSSLFSLPSEEAYIKSHLFIHYCCLKIDC